ncbi:MAG: aspartate aminotransferase family protein [Acidimicrobiia bacterium]
MMSDSLNERAKEIVEKEIDLYESRTKESSIHTARAKKVLPRGVPSSLQFYDPHPVVAQSAQGAWLTDVDGNEYVDFNMGFGALMAGHCHPILKEVIKEQLEKGTLYVTPCDTNAEVAELLCERFGMDMFRFTNSGNEATSDAIRVARGFTGKDKIVKLEGGYHGHHDDAMISVKPPLDKAGPEDAPYSIPSSLGIPQSAVETVSVVPYNNPVALEKILANGEYAAFILEPVMENISICLPDEGYLQEIREITSRYNVLLIFDEVKTGITSGNGTTFERYGVQPDLLCLAKAIGGGLPLGAFGGSKEIMDFISENKVLHMGTYNGNPLVMAAAKAVLTQICTPQEVDRAIALNESMLSKMKEIIRQYNLPAHTLQRGAKGCITWSRERVRNYRDYKSTDFDLAYAQWLWGINRGILLPPGLDEQWLVSVQHTENECNINVEVFEAFVAELVA